MTDKPIAIRINDELYRQLRVATVTDGVTVKSVMEEAIRAYVADFERRQRAKSDG